MKNAIAVATAALLGFASSAFAAEPKTPDPGLYEIKYGTTPSVMKICLKNRATPTSFGQWEGVQFAPEKTTPRAPWGGYFGYICDYHCDGPNAQQGNVKFYGMVSLPEGGHPEKTFWETELIEVATDGSGWTGRWTTWNSVGISNPEPGNRPVTMTSIGACQ
jgi:hypothetical protein